MFTDRLVKELFLQYMVVNKKAQSVRVTLRAVIKMPEKIYKPLFQRKLETSTLIC